MNTIIKVGDENIDVNIEEMQRLGRLRLEEELRQENEEAEVQATPSQIIGDVISNFEQNNDDVNTEDIFSLD